MKKGIIVKGIGGFYYVSTFDSKIIECKLRGKFRKNNIIPMVGDHVIININDLGQGIIEDILPRKNCLIRPPVSNLDQVVIVFAIRDPNPNFQLLDRFLIQGERQKLSIIICFNKIELENNSEKKEEIKKIYTKAGYPVVFTSVKENIGIKNLRKYLEGKVTVFAGSSGVGKSSLLNMLNYQYYLKTGSISKKIGRGKHTTRHVELLPYKNHGFVVDTPGFSTLSMQNIKKEELMNYFPEFHPYIGQCKFNSCLHLKEPKCALRNALFRGEIPPSRYDNYVYFLEEIEKQNYIK
ncbi:ribosome small subunit-dependent GTPase A [Garciella nitratireducens]|uniref:ribosome small subunit-dependent GTPase A n=1 Tax=Garciella nitratireducens TaxID=218205 RepID=UPI000DE8795F|nr:ribosome small subunit-dependent GTPase A [Garciella nitratireducens]RBP41111.1 ribosome biogenesis GTPase [Garciella nitratireducens]